jgi:hypothetical protein
MPADLLAALTTAAGLARTANDTGQPLSRREQARDRLHAWTDDHPWMFADVVERVRELEAECGRLRKDLKDYMDAASVEAFEGDLARKDAASLAAKLAEAVKLLEPFDLCTIHHTDCPNCRAAAFVAKHKGNVS